jgi:hypothetical protein
VRICLAAAFILAATGCGILTPSEESPPVTEAALATMVVQEDELKQDFPVLERDAESGPLSAQEMADQTFDPDDTASVLRKAGWLRGYLMDYTNPSRKGLVSVFSSVALFDSAGAARAVAANEENGVRVRDGKTVGGATYKRLELYNPEVGDDSWGIEFSVGTGKATYHITAILFRREQVLGRAIVTRTDDTVVRAQVLKIAQATDDRIERILSGELKPAELSAEDDPRALLMHRSDFGLYLSLAHQGVFRNGPVQGYLQEFDVDRGTLGASHPNYLRTVAQVFPSPKAAAEEQRYFSSAEGRNTIVARYLEAFLKGSFEPRDVQVRALAVKGTDSAGLVFTFDAPKGRILGVMVTSRVGSARGNLTVMGPANEMRPADVVKLLPLLRTRLGAES